MNKDKPSPSISFDIMVNVTLISLICLVANTMRFYGSS